MSNYNKYHLMCLLDIFFFFFEIPVKEICPHIFQLGCVLLFSCMRSYILKIKALPIPLFANIWNEVEKTQKVWLSGSQKEVRLATVQPLGCEMDWSQLG